MNIALPLIALGPAAGAVFILAGGGSERARRAFALAGLGAGVGATIFVLIHVLPGRIADARGLQTDAWRAGLALAALVVAAAGVRGRGGLAVIPHLAAATAAAGSMIVTDVFSVAGFLVAATASTMLAAIPDGTVRAVRACGWLVVSDLLAVVALLLAAGDGMRVAPTVDGVSAGLLLAAAALRAGLVPLVRGPLDAIDASPSHGALMLGPLRAQALLLAAWVGGSAGGGARALAIGGAIAAASWARSAARDRSAVAASASVAALVFAGLGLGGVSAVWGAVLLAAGMFVGSVLLLLGAGGIAAGSVAVAPLGATLPGAALLCSAALARGVGGFEELVVGVAAALALAWLVAAGVSGARSSAPGAHPFWLVVPALAALAIAVVPGRARAAIAESVAPVLGVGRPLPDLPGAIPDDLGILFAVAAAGGVVAATIRRPALAPRGVETAGQASDHAAVPRAMLAGLSVAAVGVLALLWVGIRRGFI